VLKEFGQKSASWENFMRHSTVSLANKLISTIASVYKVAPYMHGTVEGAVVFASVHFQLIMVHWTHHTLQ